MYSFLIFEKVLSRQIGLQIKSVEFRLLKTETTLANLKLEGKLPVLKYWLKMWAKTSKVISDSSRKSLEEISYSIIKSF